MKVRPVGLCVGAALALMSTVCGTSAEGYDRAIIPQQRVYKQEDGVPLRLFIWSPTEDRRTHPALVVFHGGGWRWGGPQQFGPLCQLLAKNGVVCISVEYRPGGGDGVLADAAEALAWTQRHAPELDIASNEIGVGGGSAGGYLAAGLSVLSDAVLKRTETRPDAVILFNPLLGPSALGPQYDLHDQIHAPLPPLLVMHGDADRFIPLSTVTAFLSAARAAGTSSATLITYPGRDHGFTNYQQGRNPDFRTSAGHVIDFLAALGWVPCRRPPSAAGGAVGEPFEQNRCAMN